MGTRTNRLLKMGECISAEDAYGYKLRLTTPIKTSFSNLEKLLKWCLEDRLESVAALCRYRYTIQGPTTNLLVAVEGSFAYSTEDVFTWYPILKDNPKGTGMSSLSRVLSLSNAIKNLIGSQASTKEFFSKFRLETIQDLGLDMSEEGLEKDLRKLLNADHSNLILTDYTNGTYTVTKIA